MADEKTLIRTLSEPSIELDELSGMDVETGSATQINSPISAVNYSKQYGGAFPVIQINKTLFNADQITGLELRSVGPIPTITVTFNINDKSFYSTSFPKDGDVLSVMIRSKNDLFKPIHNDYEITNIKVFPRPGGGENTAEDMVVNGILKIPGYMDIKNFSKKGTSMNCIHNVAADLKLGFASNEVDTADEQTWLCAYDQPKDFIYETVNAAWKDDESFFTYFIDQNYYLNFVNVNPMFSDSSEFEEALGKELLTQDFGTDSTNAEFKGKMILSNWDDMSSTNFFIQSYSLQNFAASINNTHGYRREIRFYDGFIHEPETFLCDPLTTIGAEEDKILMKGRPGEDSYLSQIQTKWLGIQYGEDGENCHGKFNIARITNFQNNVHLDKMSLVVNLENLNFNLRRMQPIPVIIVIKKDATRKYINEPDDEEVAPNVDGYDKKTLSAEETPILLDKTLSGNYVIKDIIYRYVKGEFKQQVVLIRREWPVPPQSH